MPKGVEEVAGLGVAAGALAGEEAHRVGGHPVQAGGGEPVDVLHVGEEADEHHAHPDHRHGREHQQDRADAPVLPPAAVAGRPHAGDEGDGDRDRQAEELQQRRHRQRLDDDVADRPGLDEAVAQVRHLQRQLVEAQVARQRAEGLVHFPRLAGLLHVVVGELWVLAADLRLGRFAPLPPGGDGGLDLRVVAVPNVEADGGDVVEPLEVLDHDRLVQAVTLPRCTPRAPPARRASCRRSAAAGRRRCRWGRPPSAGR